MSDEGVYLRLTGAEALVFFEWLTDANERGVVSADGAEQRVLYDLESQLETKLVDPFMPNYTALLDAAKRTVLEA